MADKNYDEMIWNKPSLPSKVKEDEDVILVVREDISILIFKFLSLFIVFFALLVVRTIAGGYTDAIWSSVFDTVIFCVNIVLIAMFTVAFHNYYLSLQIVTTERVIDIDQQGLFKREVNELPIEKIEDVSMKQSTLLSVLFNYGNVVVQTAGSNSGNTSTEDVVNGFVFNNVPNPRQVTNIVNKLYHESQDRDKREAAMYNAQFMGQMMGGKPVPPQQTISSALQDGEYDRSHPAYQNLPPTNPLQ